MNESASTGFPENRKKILEEALGQPSFKDSLRLFLKDIDPEAGPGLVRTILGKDIEVPLAVVSSLPAMANFLIRAAMELVTQVRSKYPAQMLAGMVQALLQDVDRETLASLVTEMKQLGRDLAPAWQEFLQTIEAQEKEQP
jgi:hypothetical protein